MLYFLLESSKKCLVLSSLLRLQKANVIYKKKQEQNKANTGENILKEKKINKEWEGETIGSGKLC